MVKVHDGCTGLNDSMQGGVQSGNHPYSHNLFPHLSFHHRLKIKTFHSCFRQCSVLNVRL